MRVFVKMFLAMIFLAVFNMATFAAKPYLTIRVLSADAANKAAKAAESYCAKKGYQVSVAVVDRYGNLLAFNRNPLAGAHTIRIAADKAYTAATFQGSTIELAKTLKFLRGVPRVVLVGGGIAIRVGGHMYGAIGISGAPGKKTPGDVDHECGMAGIKAIKGELEFAD